MILNVLVEKLKRRSKEDFKGRHFEAALILQAVSDPGKDLGPRQGFSPKVHTGAAAWACDWVRIGSAKGSGTGG